MDLDELEDGEEFCPICRRLNQPGADDTCEHYLGTAWDSTLMWGEPVETFERVWSRFCEVVQEDEERARPLAGQLLAALRNVEGLNQEALKQDFWNLHSADALLSLLTIDTGETNETAGMLSGSGFSLYSRDPKQLAAVNGIIKTFLDGPQALGA